MLLLHQTGSVKVGEVVRYTLTYTPTKDRILPPPKHLHVKVKNTSAIPLRAAYLHGPYTLYAACYPSTFDPNVKQDSFRERGEPQFEPQLKAAGSWSAQLIVPEEIRKDAERQFFDKPQDDKEKSVTWIIEVASQVIFSKTAAVHFELLVGRDEKSVELGFHGVIGTGQGAPGRLEDHEYGRRNVTHPKGVFSKAVRLFIDNTESLWNTPPFPEWDEDGKVASKQGPQHGDMRDVDSKETKKSRKQKKIHLVLLTHGLHSNLGADMLFMKESIDSAAKKAREDAKARKAELKTMKKTHVNKFTQDQLQQKAKSTPELAIAPTDSVDNEDEEDDEDEEEIFVRGFNGNAVRTEKGIQYLGKRFAKYVLSMTYPDQPYLPVKSSISKSITRSFTSSKSNDSDDRQPIHKNSSIVKDTRNRDLNLPYKITSISFIGHSLGGLVQTYAVAYIQKHSPEFFDLIKPVNFVALATPFLGLSNENPMYVKFALDFGLVGRSGQDLGLTWRAPNIAKNSWGAMIGGLGGDNHKNDRQQDPGSKPLLRILPTGPAHTAFKKFRNRTVYSNVVNDGIVPLRTSCLLFLDWRGLERVEKARRENGLVGTMVNWGWQEMTGQNASSPRRALTWGDLFNDAASGDESNSPSKTTEDFGSNVPQAEASQGLDYDQRSEPNEHQWVGKQGHDHSQVPQHGPPPQQPSLWNTVVSFFKPDPPQKSPHHSPKSQRIYRRGQTMPPTAESTDHSQDESNDEDPQSPRNRLVRGSSLYTNNSENGDVQAPPKTTFFEAAGDVLNPPLPPREYLVDPSLRPRTIFHDRIYHPDDIPAPPVKRPKSFLRTISGVDALSSNSSPTSPVSSKKHDFGEVGSMKIEEKIARAYHKDLSWRKVLVRLEPDAHNNMIVRRMFANAYGWPVVKHLCDTHFAYTAAAKTRDDEEETVERAKPADAAVGPKGELVKGQEEPPKPTQTLSKREEVAKLRSAASEDHFLHSSEVDQDIATPDNNSLHSDWVARKGRPESESRDRVPDLVSRISAQGEKSNSYSSLNSGKAALSRLARQDSARWSDQFFEGSEDDSDESESNELDSGFRKSQAKGLEPQIAETLTASPQSASRRTTKSNTGRSDRSDLTIKPILPEDDQVIVAEPSPLEPEHANHLTELGLRKSIEDQVSAPVVGHSAEEPRSQSQGHKDLRQSNVGIAEQVAMVHLNGPTP